MKPGIHCSEEWQYGASFEASESEQRHEKVTDDQFDISRVQKVALKSTVAYGNLQFQQTSLCF